MLIFTDVILTRNIIATYNVTSQGECLFHCIENKGCLSYNFQYKNNTKKKRGNCDLNSKTINSCPLRKIREDGHSYFEEINVLDKKPIYGSEKNPGLSCLDINSCHDNNYEYWVSSEETSWNVVKVFCYMNTAEETSFVNLALHKPATQNATSYAAPASRAVDGKRISNFWKNSCTHTHKITSPWWRVDLQNVYFIRKLIITNRSDCCAYRLSNFEIRIGLSLANNGNSNPSCGGKHSLRNETTKSIVCPQPMIGRYVNIIIPAPGQTLTLCEVEVYP